MSDLSSILSRELSSLSWDEEDYQTVIELSIREFKRINKRICGFGIFELISEIQKEFDLLACYGKGDVGISLEDVEQECELLFDFTDCDNSSLNCELAIYRLERVFHVSVTG